MVKEYDSIPFTKCSTTLQRSKSSNKMFNAIGKYVAWNIMQDLTSRGDEFDLHFALVHMASFRVVYSVALGLLEFETNNVRRVWLQEVADEYSMLRMKLRDSIMDRKVVKDVIVENSPKV